VGAMLIFSVLSIDDRMDGYMAGLSILLICC
jgi:hypothetical protein